MKHKKNTFEESLVPELQNKLKTINKLQLKIKVTAGRSSGNEITGYLGEKTLKIKISAAPEKGKANKELVRFLSSLLNVASDNIRIVSGRGSQNKIIEISA